ncbi:hypothetical protein [Sporomusa aerivorans]|uniref:hypothetical protein n=1 Tax=Sporomusa aerivorans TaxID=204936 RepID=UPI00352ABB14
MIIPSKDYPKCPQYSKEQCKLNYIRCEGGSKASEHNESIDERVPAIGFHVMSDDDLYEDDE